MSLNNLSYSHLKNLGNSYIQQLTDQWSDHNSHDPGVTILEQLCYAITDLSYRINHDDKDLFTPDHKKEYLGNLYDILSLLPTAPTTLNDLRKILMDLDGIQNAFIEPIYATKPGLQYDNNKSNLSFDDEKTLDKKHLKGLYVVRVIPEGGWDQHELEKKVSCSLLQNRNLCEDIAEIKMLEPEDLMISVSIDVKPGFDAMALITDIYDQLEQFISPSMIFYSAEELFNKGYAISEILDGPLLEHGFIDTQAFQQLAKKEHLRISDLVQILMDIPNIITIREIHVNNEKWSVSLSDDKYPIVKNISVSINDTEVVVDPQVLTQKLKERREGRMVKKRSGDEKFLARPEGKNRKVETYYSLQHHFPKIYGIGEEGLPQNASPERQAQAKQLKAYLFFFEQILANNFSQLAHIPELFSVNGNATNTYFEQMPNVPGIHDLIDSNLYVKNQNTEGHLNQMRRNQFLDHLLARYSETLPDYLPAHTTNGSTEGLGLGKSIKRKQFFLKNYPLISQTRGHSYDYSAPASISSLERKVHLMLDIPLGYLNNQIENNGNKERFFMVEHILLRPLDADKDQYISKEFGYPFLANTSSEDPFSLQLSFIFSSELGRFKDPQFRNLVEKTILEETPVHLHPHFIWLEEDAMQVVETAYLRWIEAMRYYSVPTATQLLNIRATRNRLIDLLGEVKEESVNSIIGNVYPIIDLSLKLVKVRILEGSYAEVVISNPQEGVRYQLYRLGTGEEKVSSGNSASIAQFQQDSLHLKSDLLEFPEEETDRELTFWVKATKTVGAELSLFLNQSVTVAVSTLKGNLPVYCQSRPIAYGETAAIIIESPQNIVNYSLFIADMEDRFFHYDDAIENFEINTEMIWNENKSLKWSEEINESSSIENNQCIFTLDNNYSDDKIVKVLARMKDTDRAEELENLAFIHVAPNPEVELKLVKTKRHLKLNKPEVGVNYLLILKSSEHDENNDSVIISSHPYIGDKRIPLDKWSEKEAANKGLRTGVNLALNATTSGSLFIPIPKEQNRIYHLIAHKMNNGFEISIGTISVDRAGKIQLTEPID